MAKVLLINDATLLDAANDKYTMYIRIPQFMRRPALNLITAEDNQIASFASNNKLFVGKTNRCFSSGFKIFCGSDKNIVEQIRATDVTLLEKWIVQHSEINAVYSGSVNTIRIHTVRNSNETRVFLDPVLYIGCDGSVTDHVFGKQYLLFIQKDGFVKSGFIDDDLPRVCRQHRNSKCAFKNIKIPFIKEAYNIVLKAAEEFPELRFLGWDVAITEEGPVIVEANALSESIDTYQLMNAMCTKKGLRKEIQEMLDYGMEDVEYDMEHGFKARSFALDKYISEWRCPTLFERYTVLLQSALHRHGIDFSNEAHPFNNISFKLENNKLILNIGDENLIWTLPEDPAENLYESDKHAMCLAAEIYEQLKKIGK